MERRIWMMPWTEFAETSLTAEFVILPVGVVEAHGPHLPLGTDFLIPERLAPLLAERINALVAPPIPYGVVESLSGFPGSLSISQGAFESLVYDVISSLAQWGFGRVIVLNGHGGSKHLDALRRALRRLWFEAGVKSILINWWVYAEPIASEVLGPSEGHASTSETAAVVALLPEAIREVEDLEAWSYSRREGIEPFPSPGSIMARGAPPRRPGVEESRRFLESLVDSLVEEISRISSGWDSQEEVYYEEEH
ncbi:MAG: hypothetical protein DRO06_04805 [Thermoproteota archaeon]|nr:MAG: hypothetical protein DRO06_04805 [Candidatus Korarchaeota archaeon]